MKKIYISRHAKSSWDDLSLGDFDRGLNKRGNRDAPIMAQRFKDLYEVDILVSSPAKRARLTAEYFAQTLGRDVSEIHLVERLYHGLESDYYETIEALDDVFGSVIMFGHNPTITDIANEVRNEYLHNVPTCGIIVMEADISKWADFDINKCNFLNFMYPKQYV